MIRLEKIFKGEIKMKSNKGITLIALAVTIIVLIIIASVGTYSGVQALRDSKENAQLSEVRMIQQAVLENYTKYKGLLCGIPCGKPFERVGIFLDFLCK